MLWRRLIVCGCKHRMPKSRVPPHFVFMRCVHFSHRFHLECSIFDWFVQTPVYLLYFVNVHGHVHMFITSHCFRLYVVFEASGAVMCEWIIRRKRHRETTVQVRKERTRQVLSFLVFLCSSALFVFIFSHRA